MQEKSLNKLPPEALNLSRQRIAAKQPEMEKLLGAIENSSTWKALASAYKEGLVSMTDTVKTLALMIHDTQKHQAPFGLCPNPLCKVSNVQINDGIKLIARATELEPREGPQ